MLRLQRNDASSLMETISLLWTVSRFFRTASHNTVRARVCFGTFNQLVCPVISGRVASGSEDSAITAWNINSVSSCEDPLPPQLPIDTQTTHAEGTSVFCLAAMKDNTLASGCSNGSIKLWRGAQCEATLLGHSQVHTCNTK